MPQHRVFLSSTFGDLKEYRETVQTAIRQLGAVDVSMEHFGARDERPTLECIRLVREESDSFVGVYAHKYGYIPDGGHVSICQMEYQAASDAALPRFIYLVDENHPWPPAHIDSDRNAKRLQNFKKDLLKRHICARFGGRDQLATLVVADLGRHIAMLNAPKVGPRIPVRDIGLESLRGPVIESPDEWNARRNDVYQRNRGVFLTHVIRPSSVEDQEFDVFIYLIRHKAEDLKDIRLAEFFLGPYWQNKVFPAVEQNGFIGIATAAYGTFLCVCRVTFNDGGVVYLERYIDFETQRTGGGGA
jgi:hypothetical protein